MSADQPSSEATQKTMGFAIGRARVRLLSGDCAKRFRFRILMRIFLTFVHLLFELLCFLVVDERETGKA